ncbi:MAG: ribonuclease III [Coprococcus sp.]
MSNRDFHELEKKIGYTFKNIDYLVTAMTHTSYTNERKINKTESYERSEFLGDAILEFIVSEYLYIHKKDYKEGKLTKLRASLVCEFTLSQISKSLGFGEFVLLSKGEDLTGGRNRNSIMCDLFEAVLGAIYLDGGIEPAKAFVYTYLLDDIETKSLFYDAKSTLQELMQKDGKVLTYNLINEMGPDHNKTYITEAVIDDVAIARGEGASIKSAEQTAAYNALLQLKKKQV